MNNHRLSTHNSHQIIEISKDRIDHVLSLEPVYEYSEDGYCFNKVTGKKVAVKCKVVLIDPEGNEELVFSSIVECGRYLNEDRKRITRYINKDKVLVCHNGKKYYVKDL